MLHSLLTVQTRERDEKKKEGALLGKLQVVGKDLNLLDSTALTLKDQGGVAQHKQEEDLHAIATLYRRIASVQGKLAAEKTNVKTEFLAEEHEDLVDGKATIRQIAPKIKEVYAVEQKDVKGMRSNLATLKAALINRTRDLKTSISKISKFEQPKQVVVTLTTNANGQLTAAAQPVASTNTPSTTTSPQTLFPSPQTLPRTKTPATEPSSQVAKARQQAQEHLQRKFVSEHKTGLAARGGSGVVGQFSTVWSQSKLETPRTSSLAETTAMTHTVKRGGGHGGALVKTKSVQKVKASGGVSKPVKNPKGCLIHLSGVVKGLDADNSIEC